MDIDSPSSPSDVSSIDGSDNEHWEEEEQPSGTEDSESETEEQPSGTEESETEEQPSGTEDSESETEEYGDYTKMTMYEDEDSLSEMSDTNDDSPKHGLGLTGLPEEVLARILSFLSPYEDQDKARLVCHQWHQVIKSLIRRRLRTFNSNIGVNKVGWTEIAQSQGIRKGVSNPPYRLLGVRERYSKEYAHLNCISERFSHSSAYLDGSLWVFGGCTKTNTTFNDLWRFDLTARRWRKPVAMSGFGMAPCPKACATMVAYEGKLVLFGGWSQPVSYPLHQTPNYFSELHIYNPKTKCWKMLNTNRLKPDALGGHSASIVPGRMVVFGGSPRNGQGSNKVWVYDFKQSMWYTPKIEEGVSPEPRYGQYQTTLDDSHILIMGGCAGPHKIFDDFYLLNLTPNCWYWTKLTVNRPELAPKLAWCSPVCRAGSKLVVLCKSQNHRESLNVRPDVYCVADPPTPSDSSPGVKRSLSPATDQSESVDGNEAKRPRLLEEAPSGLNDGSPLVRVNHGEEDIDPASFLSPGHQSLLALERRLDQQDDTLPGLRIRIRKPNKDSNVLEGNNRHHQHDQGLNQRHGERLHRTQFQPPNEPPVVLTFCPPVVSSIRPDVNISRQRQLEALHRYEELLRSKSKASAESVRKSLEQSLGTTVVLEEAATVPVTDRMDVYVADFSSALTRGEIEWKPESQYIPVGAPEETMGCSFVEGRGELIFFGGLYKDSQFPVVKNTALNNRMYILHA